MKRNRIAEFEIAIDEIRLLAESLPSGIDYEADPNDKSPEDATAFTGGLIWQICEKISPSDKPLTKVKAQMTEQDIDDLLGVFAESLTPADKQEFLNLNAEAFGEHCENHHRADYDVCDNPACQAGFEVEILCDLYAEMKR